MIAIYKHTRSECLITILSKSPLHSTPSELHHLYVFSSPPARQIKLTLHHEAYPPCCPTPQIPRFPLPPITHHPHCPLFLRLLRLPSPILPHNILPRPDLLFLRPLSCLFTPIFRYPPRRGRFLHRQHFSPYFIIHQSNLYFQGV